MKIVLETVKESVLQEKAKHAVGVATSGTGATVAATTPAPASSGLLEMLVWLPHLAVFAGFAVSCALFYKTYIDIKLAKIELAKRIDEIKGDE